MLKKPSLPDWSDCSVSSPGSESDADGGVLEPSLSGGQAHAGSVRDSEATTAVGRGTREVIPFAGSPRQFAAVCGTQPGEEGVRWQWKQPPAALMRSCSVAERADRVEHTGGGAAMVAEGGAAASKQVGRREVSVRSELQAVRKRAPRALT